MALSITNLRKGTIFKLDDEPYRVVEYSQKVMGRGGSIVNVKIKSLTSGRVLDKTFKGNEQLDSADVENRNVQYLYNDSEGYHFMDTASYEQLSLKEDDMAGKGQFMKEGDMASALFFEGRIVGVELPKNVPLLVTYTENAVRGDTSSAITKEATLETGLVVRVPAFIKQGDMISVDTATGAYRERLKG